MDEEEIKKLTQKAQIYKDGIHGFILTTSPQIDGFKNSYRKYYEYIITVSSVFAGLTQALIASNFLKVDMLTVLGFISFVLTVIIAFLGFRRDLLFTAKYTMELKNMQKVFSNFSGEIFKFLTNKISLEDYKKKQSNFENKYPDMKNNSKMSEADAYENLILREINENLLSNINLITATFLLGIIFVALSVLLPQIICFR